MAPTDIGEDVAVSEFSISGQGMLANTKVQDARCEYYDLPYAKSGVDKKQFLKERTAPSRRELAAPITSQLYAVRKYSRDARDEAARMVRASKDGEIMEIASQGLALMDSLQVLWGLRSVREDEWASLVNFLQAALSKEEFERFTEEQCETVHIIIANYLAAGLVRDDEVTKARCLLRKVGLDPWKAISKPKSQP